MNKNKDYYAILGVHTTAEIAVIEAAYRALAKRYNPDVNKEDPDEAHRRMQEINEAHEILSNTTKRKEYDDLKGSGTQEAEDFFRGEEDVEPEYDPLDEDWKVALEYYPELEQYLNKLRRISWKLGYGFKAYIVDTKNYEIGAKIYTQMFEEFIERYFGTNKSIIEFANTLIESNKKQALKELNKVVKVLDVNQAFKKTAEVISKIEKKYELNEYDPIKVRRKKEENEKKAREEEERIKYWKSMQKKERESDKKERGHFYASSFYFVLFLVFLFICILLLVR